MYLIRQLIVILARNSRKCDQRNPGSRRDELPEADQGFLAHFSVMPDEHMQRAAHPARPASPQYSTSICLKSSFSGSTNPSTGTSTMTVTANSSAALGQYSVTVTGTSGSATATTTFTLGVFAQGFTLSAYGLSIGQGTSGTSSIYM